MSRVCCLAPTLVTQCRPACCRVRALQASARSHRNAAHVWQRTPTLRSTWSVSLAARAAEDEEEYEPEMDAMERMDKSLVACEKELVSIRAGEPLASLSRAACVLA